MHVAQVLIADFFFVVLSLVWFALGVGSKSAFDSTVRPLPFLTVKIL